MTPPVKGHKSLADKASWASLLFAAGGTLLFMLIGALQSISGTKDLPRGAGSLILFIPLAALVLAILTGVVSFFLLRKADISSKAVAIFARNICGIGLGVCAGFYCYIAWGMLTFGF